MSLLPYDKALYLEQEEEEVSDWERFRKAEVLRQIEENRRRREMLRLAAGEQPEIGPLVERIQVLDLRSDRLAASQVKLKMLGIDPSTSKVEEHPRMLDASKLLVVLFDNSYFDPLIIDRLGPGIREFEGKKLALGLDMGSTRENAKARDYFTMMGATYRVVEIKRDDDTGAPMPSNSQTVIKIQEWLRGATSEGSERPPKMPRTDEIAAALIAHRGNVAAAAQSLLKRMRM
jgi:hypothetical protein